MRLSTTGPTKINLPKPAFGEEINRTEQVTDREEATFPNYQQVPKRSAYLASNHNALGVSRNDHGNYHQNKLLSSGDIETQPGPWNCKKKTSKTNILVIEQPLTELPLHCSERSEAICGHTKASECPGKSDNNAADRASAKVRDYYKTENSSTTNENCSNNREYEMFQEDKLMRSGDVERQPGPRSLKSKTSTGFNLTMLTLMLILIFYKIRKIGKINTNPKPTNLESQETDNISTASIILYKRQFDKSITNVSRSSQMLIMILLSGDIHPNPGEIQKGTCQICGEQQSNLEALTCGTCHDWCHLKCMKKSPSDDPLETSLNQINQFLWICPKPDCLPTHYSGNQHNIQLSPNRFSIIADSREEKNNSNMIPDQPTEKELATKHLFRELPRITSKEYTGRDICRVCLKTVGENQRAVSCDGCERWLHVNCTDMESRTYKKFREQRIFQWSCHKCRHTEIPTTTRVNLDLLKPGEYPLATEDIPKVDMPLILSLNCRSIMNKVDELMEICYTLEPTIVFLTETWMDHTIPENYIVPKGYSIFRKDRSENFKQRYGKANGGGIAILHKSNIKVKLKSIAAADDEMLWVEVMLRRRLLIGVSYRATYTDLLTEVGGNNKLNTMLETAHVQSDNVILLGDLNCDYNSKNPDPETIKLIETCGAYGMSQLITTPTRITEDCKTTIDHIWTDSSKGLVQDSGTFLGISDHLGIYATLDFKANKAPRVKSKMKRSWRNYSEVDFRETLESIIEKSNIEDEINKKDINKSLEYLMNALLQATDKHAPLRETKEKENKKPSIPWFNKEIEEKKREKNNLLKLFYAFGDPKDKRNAKKINNELNHLKENSKKLYYTDKLSQSDGDSKQTWDILKELTNGYNEKQQIEPDNTSKETANSFNTYFATVGSEIQEKLSIKDRNVKTDSTGFKFRAESERNVIKLINRIRTDVAVGVDGINARILKDASDIIAPTLTKIINLGYETNTFPDILKVAAVKPIHKKDCHNNPANYRPISILPTISKVFERSAVDQLVNFLETILSASQHAYRKGHSTTTCLAEVTNKIYESLDKNLIVGMVSMDLSKAFDSICHTHLLQKLSDMGLHENAVFWIKSYLHLRKQKTSFKDVVSEESTVTSGVPQGSILGPILFLCFTNNLTNSFPEAKVVSYADDSQFIVTGRKMEDIKYKLEKIIEKAERWYKSNSLMSNPTKTEVIIFTPTRQNNLPEITCYENGKTFNLEARKELKILGIYIDCNMTWNTHTQKLRNKTIGIVRHLHRVNKLLPMKSKLKLYDSLVASHLNYGDVIWSGCNQANKQKLQNVQNFALKSILGKKKSDSATQALETLKYLNLEEKRQIHEGVFAHKILSGKMPLNLTEEYENLKPRLQNRSADKGILNIPIHKTTRFESSVLYRTVKTWNG